MPDDRRDGPERRDRSGGEGGRRGGPGSPRRDSRAGGAARGRAGEQRSGRAGGASRSERDRGGRARVRRDGPTPDRPRGEVPEGPEITADVAARELEDEIRAELTTLSKAAADTVARHLVMAGRLLDDDPELAYQHALAARRRAGRIGVVREAAGVAAYLAGRYAEALSELRAARRITGSAEYLPIMADCERGLGRPRRALDLAADPAATGLSVASRIELLIVAAGARRDLGDMAAAVVALQVPELRWDTKEPWLARLRYAYADALEAVGRRDEAHRWFARAAEVDIDEETDAVERLAALDGAEASDS